MADGAATPEELESLLEDALILGDRTALQWLYEPGSVVLFGSGQAGAGGVEDIAAAMLQLADDTGAYLAQPRRIIQSRDLALLVGRGVINVARRGRGKTWRFALCLLGTE